MYIQLLRPFWDDRTCKDERGGITCYIAEKKIEEEWLLKLSLPVLINAIPDP